MEQPRGTPGKGRRRIDTTKPRPDKAARLITFSKRCSGLFKNTSELSICYGAHLAVVVFSEAGNTFAFGSPSVDAVLCLLGGDGDGDGGDRKALEDICWETETAMGQVAAEKTRMKDIGDKVTKAMALAGRKFWWEADVEALEEEELLEFAGALGHLRYNVSRRVEKLLSVSPPGTRTAAVAPGTLNSN